LYTTASFHDPNLSRACPAAAVDIFNELNRVIFLGIVARINVGDMKEDVLIAVANEAKTLSLVEKLNDTFKRVLVGRHVIDPSSAGRTA
jgi:hypothetical protein